MAKSTIEASRVLILVPRVVSLPPEPWGRVYGMLVVSIEGLHSLVQHLCKFIGTKKKLRHQKRVQLPLFFWKHQHGHRLFHCLGTP